MHCSERMGEKIPGSMRFVGTSQFVALHGLLRGGCVSKSVGRFLDWGTKVDKGVMLDIS